MTHALGTSPRPIDSLLARLRVPVISAPMLIVSGPELVIAACRAGILGSFPTANPRGEGELEQWLTRIEDALAQAQDSGEATAPYVPNLIVHKSNTRLDSDLAAIIAHRPPVVITSVGSPAHVLPALHDAGIEVWADVASVKHAERAMAVGVDGLILLTAGAGGQTGYANPFSFVRAVRAMFDGVVVVSGGQADGWSLWAAQALGCDLGYMGTRFIATHESNAQPEQRQMIVDSELDDIHLTNALGNGLQTNMMRKSIVAAGLDPADYGVEARPFTGMSGLPGDGEPAPGPKRYRDLWSAGHSVSGVKEILSVAEVVDRLAAEYEEARSRTFAR
ncbi:MAG: 2-nitropropane dioxygenase [Pseudonocardiales bacterium]|nr:2-nitropropane dioxygenase [Pseudonocardiales bacterium]